MSNSGKLEAIWLKLKKGAPMDARRQATLEANVGLVGNVKQNGKRQVTILEKEKWEDVMAAMGVDLDPSARGANMMISGIDLTETTGQILQIGGCRIRIYGETKPCSHMDDALMGLQDAMRGNWSGGVFGEVLDDGEIAVGDSVQWLT